MQIPTDVGSFYQNMTEFLVLAMLVSTTWCIPWAKPGTLIQVVDSSRASFLLVPRSEVANTEALEATHHQNLC